MSRSSWFVALVRFPSPLGNQSLGCVSCWLASKGSICLFLSFWFYIGQWYTFLNFIPFHIATLCFCIIMLLYQRFIFFQSSHFWFSVSICHKSIFNILCKLLLHSLKRKACHSVLHFSDVRDSIDHPGFCLGKEKFRFECYLNCIPPPSTISN